MKNELAKSNGFRQCQELWCFPVFKPSTETTFEASFLSPYQMENTYNSYRD